MGQTEIPNKLYFRIGEVADLVGVKPYVLRYWETEFPDIKPVKSKSGQRLYKRRDVELLVMIKALLYNERFTISGARQRLRTLGKEHRAESQNGGEVPQMALDWRAAPKATENKPTMTQASASQSHSTNGSVPKDQKKLLLKIKKDLEQVLDALGS